MWSWTPLRRRSSAMAAVKSTACVVHPGVIAVNTAKGKVRWGADIGSRFTLVAVHHLLFAIHVMGGVINVLDARSGKTLRRLAIPARAGQPEGALVAGGTLYVKGSKELVALRP